VTDKITITQAVAKFGISRSILNDLILKGRVNAEKRSGVWYLSEKKLFEYQHREEARKADYHTAKAVSKLLKISYCTILHKVKLGIIKNAFWDEENRHWLIPKSEVEAYGIILAAASNKKPPNIPPTWHQVGEQIDFMTRLPTGLKQFVCCGCGEYQYFADLATAKQNPCCLTQTKKYWRQEDFSINATRKRKSSQTNLN
jgi:hypothetical protein